MYLACNVTVDANFNIRNYNLFLFDRIFLATERTETFFFFCGSFSILFLDCLFLLPHVSAFCFLP